MSQSPPITRIADVRTLLMRTKPPDVLRTGIGQTREFLGLIAPDQGRYQAILLDRQDVFLDEIHADEASAMHALQYAATRLGSWTCRWARLAVREERGNILLISRHTVSQATWNHFGLVRPLDRGFLLTTFSGLGGWDSDEIYATLDAAEEAFGEAEDNFARWMNQPPVVTEGGHQHRDGPDRDAPPPCVDIPPAIIE